MKNQSETHWTDKITAIVAVVAIFLSGISLWQSNQSIQIARKNNEIAQNSSSPNLKIINISDDPTLVSSQTCPLMGDRRSGTLLAIRAVHKITLTNNGGQAGSLINVLFSENGKNYQEVQLYLPENGKMSQTRKELYTKIEPGEALEIYLVALDNSIRSASAEFISAQQKHLQEGNLHGVWILYFNNETTLVDETTIAYDWSPQNLTQEIACAH